MKSTRKAEATFVVIIVLVFILVGVFTKINTYSNKVITSVNNFTDTGKVCIIDNVKYSVIEDDDTRIVYLLNPSTDNLTPLYNRDKQPMTINDYDNRK